MSGRKAVEPDGSTYRSSFWITPQRVALLEQEEDLSGETERKRQDANLRKAQSLFGKPCVFAFLRPGVVLRAYRDAVTLGIASDGESFPSTGLLQQREDAKASKAQCF